MPLIEINRSEAVSASVEALKEQGISLSKPWETFAYVAASPGGEDRFVWQSGGAKAYSILMQNGYLKPPRWIVRYAMFKGDLADRAEEYLIPVSWKGKVIKTYHKLPESAPAPSLSEDVARKAAHEAVLKRFGVDTSKITEVSALNEKRPNRTDWKFEFSDPSGYPLKDGQPRISVTIAGDKVTDTNSYVHVPEEWQRNEANRTAVTDSISSMCSLLIFLLYLAAFATAIVAWSKKRFTVNVFYIFLGSVLLMLAVSFANNWQTALSQYSAVQPFANQALTKIGLYTMTALVSSFNVALISAMVAGNLKPEQNLQLQEALRLAAAWALILAGVTAAVSAATRYTMPVWPDFGSLGATFPVIDEAISVSVGLIKQSSLFMFVFMAVELFTGSWTKRKAPAALLIIIFGLISRGNNQINTLLSWTAFGLMLGTTMLVGYIYLFRRNLQVVPLALGGPLALAQVRQIILNPCPSNIFSSTAAIIAIGIFSYLWFTSLNGNSNTAGPQ